MSIEVKAQDVIDSLLLQNQQLVAEITVLRIHLGLEQTQEQTTDSE